MFCRHCGREVPSNTSVNFCPKCGNSLIGDSGAQHQTTVKLAKFNSPSETLLQSCISSIVDLGITINKIDRVTKYIETAAVAPKSPIGNRSSFPVFHIRVMDGESSTESIIKVNIYAENMEVGTSSFDRLINALSSRNLRPTAVEDGTMDDRDGHQAAGESYPARKKEGSQIASVRRASIVLGIILGIWTAFLVVIVIEYNLRLANASENAFGFGTLIIARVAPSIEISTIVALLFVIITILLFVRPKKNSTIALVVLSIVNLLLNLWLVSQIPQLLMELFYAMLIALLFNIAVLIFSAATYRKLL